MVSPFKELTLSQKVCDKDKKQGSTVSVLSVQLKEQKGEGKDRGRSSKTPRRSKQIKAGCETTDLISARSQ